MLVRGIARSSGFDSVSQTPFSLGAQSFITRVSSTSTLSGNVVARADSIWQDAFTISGAGDLPTAVRITYALSGIMSLEESGGTEGSAAFAAAFVQIAREGLGAGLIRTDAVSLETNGDGASVFASQNLDLANFSPGVAFVATSSVDIPLNAINGSMRRVFHHFSEYGPEHW